MSDKMENKRSGAVRQAIVDTALEIALEEGFDSLSVRKIASAMGYSTGIIYYNFKDKGAIIEEILRQQAEVLRNEIQCAAEKAETLTDTFRAVYHSVFLLARKNPRMYELMAKSFLEKPQKSQAFDELKNALKRTYSHLEINIAALSHAIWSSFIGFNLSISKQPDLKAEEAEALFDAQINLILHGLTSPKNFKEGIK